MAQPRNNRRRAPSVIMLGAVLLCGGWSLLQPLPAAAQNAASQAQAPPSLTEFFGQDYATPTPAPTRTPSASLSEMFAPADASATPTLQVDMTQDAGYHSEPDPDEPVIKIVFHDDDAPAAGLADGEILITGDDPPATPSSDGLIEPAVPAPMSDAVSDKENKLYAEALQHVASGRNRQAERTLQTLIDDYPLSPLTPPALMELIRILESPLDKVTWCNYFITNYPDSEWAPRIYLIKGHVLADLGDVREAATAFELAASMLPDPALRLEAFSKHLEMLVLARKYDAVMEAYEDSPIPSLAAKDPTTQYWLMRAMMGREQWQEAMSLTERLVAIDGDFAYRAEVLLIRATLLEHVAQTDQAAVLYRQFISALPRHPSVDLIKARLQIMEEPLWPVTASRVGASPSR